MPEGVAWDVVEQVKIAGDLDAGKREAAECEFEAKSHRASDRQQGSADCQKRCAEAEYKASLDQLNQQRDTEAANHGSEPGGNVKQRHCPAVPSSRSASSGITVSKTDCAMPGTMNRPRKLAILPRGMTPAAAAAEVACALTAGRHCDVSGRVLCGG